MTPGELLIASAAAAEAMVERTPFSYPWLTYLWVLVWAGAGGAVSFFNKVREGRSRPFNVTEFVGEICTSAFVGLLTFWICEWGNVPPLLSAVFIAVTGHMGSRAMMVFERLAERWLEQRAGVVLPRKPEENA